jgi:hypothetical protein
MWEMFCSSSFATVFAVLLLLVWFWQQVYLNLFRPLFV